MLLTVNPVGGLANRLRAIASAIALARDAGCSLRILWGVNSELKARFTDLFLTAPFTAMGLAAPESVSFLPYRLLHEVPRKRNCYVSALWQKLNYSQCLRDDCMPLEQLRHLPGELCELAHDTDLYIQAGTTFYPFDTALYPQLFHPTADVAVSVAAITSRFSPVTIGCHIRRTDNEQSTRNSPTELFIDRIRRELRSTPHLKVLLCTDDEPTKLRLKALFADRIIASSNRASRRTLSGMKDAAAELFALSRTSKVYGSYYSSFSEAAGMLSGIPVIPLTLES